MATWGAGAGVGARMGLGGVGARMGLGGVGLGVGGVGLGVGVLANSAMNAGSAPKLSSLSGSGSST